MSDFGNASVTPDRVTTLVCDVAETISVTGPWCKTRMGAGVGSPYIDRQDLVDPGHSNVMFWRSLGVWTLRLIQSDISRFWDRDLAAIAILSLEKLNTILYQASGSPQAGLVEVTNWERPDDLPGMTGALPNQSASGDKFITKRVPAGASWNAALPNPSTAQFPVDGIPLDRLVESYMSFGNNQGFFLRWSIPGTIHANPAWIWSFYFGQYCLAFDGSGRAFLYEYVAGGSSSGSGSGSGSGGSSGGSGSGGSGSGSGPGSATLANWPLRHSFRYAEPSKISETAHTLAIWPCKDAQGRRYIVFSNTSLDAVGSSVSLGLNNTVMSGGQTANSNAYCIDAGARGTDPDTSPGFATAQGIIALDLRRDAKVKFQVSTLAYEKTGTLTDLPDFVEGGTTPEQPIYGRMFGYTPPLPPNAQPGATNPFNINAVIYDFITGQPFVDGQDSQPQVQFTFSGDGTDTPVLHGYQLLRQAITDTITPGAFQVSGIRQVKLTGYAGDASEEQGTINITDQYGQYPRLRNRGEFRAVLSTSFRAPDGTRNIQNAVLQEGYIYRPSNTRQGARDRQSAYPSSEWRDYVAPIMGCWKRLSQRCETSYYRLYAIDANAPPDTVTGVPPPWKVTDIIADLIAQAGYPAEEINIPDLDLRLYPGAFGAPQETQINPTQYYAEIIQRLAKNFLGAYLIRDPNAGVRGQWTLIPGTQIGAKPVYNFVTQAYDYLTPPHIQEAYPPFTSPIFGKVEEHVNPPDFNFVYVGTSIPLLGGNSEVCICNWLHNPKSFNMPGFPSLADPDHPDFSPVGIRPLVIIDPTLQATGVGGYDASQCTQNTVDWLVNRYYDFLCHAQRIANFRSTLQFIQDQNTGNWRPLRFQDPITINGVPYILKQMNADYDHDSAQFADYEAVNPITDAE